MICSQSVTGLRNRGRALYTLKCLVIIYMAARAAALQSVFETRPLLRAYHFSKKFMFFCIYFDILTQIVKIIVAFMGLWCYIYM